MSTGTDKPIPLRAWVRGTLTIHFAGAVVKKRTTLDEAHKFEQMMDKQRSSDALDWSSTAWMQWRAKKVLFSTFVRDEDYGWRLTPEERDRLASNGHRHGILATLLDHWTEVGREPAYSPVAMHVLFATALDESMETFKAVSDLLEGEQGSVHIDRTIADVNARADRHVDDERTAAYDAAKTAEPSAPAPEARDTPEPQQATEQTAAGAPHSTGGARANPDSPDPEDESERA